MLDDATRDARPEGPHAAPCRAGAAANGLLLLDTPGSFSGVLADLVSGDTLDFGTNDIASATVIAGATLDVTLTNRTNLSFALANFQHGASFAHPSAAELVVACYAQGPRILTARGEIAIEALRPGDRAVTLTGGVRDIIWTGHRRVDFAHHNRPWDVMPVTVRAHAFALGQPLRDLVLSPDHAVYVDRVLIPVRYLLNGATIVQEPATRITWWHVELDTHGVLLAEGLPAESYLDTGNRSAFAGCGSPTQIHPQFARAVWASGACAELTMAGAPVKRARERLLGRLPLLCHQMTDDPGLLLVVGGTTLQPRWFGEWLCAVVTDGANALQVMSSTARPAELDAGSEDWRCLGVAVAELRVDGIDVALDADMFELGWWPLADGLRWSDGNATLAVRPGSVIELRLPRFQRYHVSEARQTALAEPGYKTRPPQAVALYRR